MLHARARFSEKDRPSLSVYVEKNSAREAANLSADPAAGEAASADLTSSFMVVPLETIGA
jgi:hypothetical protein